MTYETVLKEAQRLSIDERTLLAHALLESIQAEAEATPLSDAQKRVLEERLARYRANPAEVLTWEEVEAELWPER